MFIVLQFVALLLWLCLFIEMEWFDLLRVLLWFRLVCLCFGVADYVSDKVLLLLTCNCLP